MYGGPYPFIQTGDIKHSSLYVNSYTQTYSDAGLAQSKLWPKGTLCITIAANIAETAILGIDACFPDSVIGFTANEDECDVRFIKYKFDIVKRQLQGFSQGAAQDNLSLEKLLSLKLLVPSVEIQRRVADILSTYDDSIENNLRRIALLEESAGSLYKEWFVRLRFPGYEHTRIVGGMPEGWHERHLRDVAAINQKTLSSSFNGEIEYIDIASVTPGSINETTFYDFENAPGRARRVLRDGDIVWSCVRPNRRSHAFVLHPATNLIASTGFAVISPTLLPTSYLYFATTTDGFVGYLENRARGAAYPAVTAKDFDEGMIVVPPHSLSSAFDGFAAPVLEQIHRLRLQSKLLRQARDLLLPRLMSGEIEV